jgi:hypothetical protein
VVAGSTIVTQGCCPAQPYHLVRPDHFIRSTASNITAESHSPRHSIPSISVSRSSFFNLYILRYTIVTFFTPDFVAWITTMGGSAPPFLYDPPSTWSFEGTSLNPKAVTQASWTPRQSRPRSDGPLLNVRRHPDTVRFAFRFVPSS